VRGLITDLPRATAWEFGGCPYGLEPLSLPAEVTADEPEPEVDGDLLAATRVLLDGAAAEGSLPAPEPVERLYWFRWITGHQVTFVLWRLLADAMSDAMSDAVDEAARPRARPAALDRASRFVLGFAAMLLYTSSCPRYVYHGVIRPSMGYVHPAFSGTWAPDFTAVRTLLRGRIPAGLVPDATSLTAAIMLSRQVHEGIAEKLVPGSRSLLQAAGGPQHDWRPDVLATLYDSYFLTVRAAVPPSAVVLQLARRLQAIQLDLAANGLYPEDVPGEQPVALRTGNVRELVRDLPALLSDLGVDAVAQSITKAPAVAYNGR
jgi:hypothetical protein